MNLLGRSVRSLPPPPPPVFAQAGTEQPSASGTCSKLPTERTVRYRAPLGLRRPSSGTRAAIRSAGHAGPRGEPENLLAEQTREPGEKDQPSIRLGRRPGTRMVLPDARAAVRPGVSPPATRCSLPEVRLGGGTGGAQQLRTSVVPGRMARGMPPVQDVLAARGRTRPGHPPPGSRVAGVRILGGELLASGPAGPCPTPPLPARDRQQRLPARSRCRQQAGVAPGRHDVGRR